jgi:HEPN domain-containing protein
MPRPEALREAREWLTRAERDLEAAAMALRGPRILPEIAAYHAQQAAEKAVKAFLVAHDQPFPPTHNVERLVQLCQAIAPEFARLAASARTLTPYATQFRYPGGPLEPPLVDAQEAERLATDVLRFIGRRLPSDETPEPFAVS